MPRAPVASSSAAAAWSPEVVEVYAPKDRTGPNRLRVMSMLALFTPGLGVLIDRDGTLRPHLRIAGPVSILLREPIGIELRLDMNVMLRDGPVEAYILLGAGVLLRRPWGS